MASKKLVFVGVAVLFLGLLLHIIGMATPRWSVGDVTVSVNTTGTPATAGNVTSIPTRFSDTATGVTTLTTATTTAAAVTATVKITTPATKRRAKAAKPLSTTITEITTAASTNATTTPAGFGFTPKNETRVMGPWMECVTHTDLEDMTECDQVGTGRGGGYDAVRTMTMLAVLCGAVSVLVSVCLVCGKLDSMWKPLLAGGTGVGAFGLIVVGCIIWAACVHEDLQDLPGADGFYIGYSLALSLVGAVFFGAGGVLAFCGGRADVEIV